MRKTLMLTVFSTCLVLTAFSASQQRKGLHFEYIAPVSLNRTPDGYFADFGKDAFGTLVLKYAGKDDRTLLIRLGEKLANGRIDPNPGGSIRYAEVKLPVKPARQLYTLQLTPDKRNTSGAAVLLPDSFGVVMPFRYVEILNAGQAIAAKDLKQKALFYSFDPAQSDFSCSDTVLNKVWELCKYSIKATSFTGLYIDGDRERIPYEADAYINQLGHYCTDQEYGMAAATLRWFMSHPTWPTEWQLHVVLMAIQDYYYSGDTSILKQFYDQLKVKTLHDLMREDGLISTTTGKVTNELMAGLGFADTRQRLKDIVDWPPGQKDTGWKLVKPEGERDGYEMVAVNTVVNCFFYENMRVMAEIAGILNNQADREFFEIMSIKVKESVNKVLFDKTRGIYVDGEGSGHASLHANMMPLAFGMVPAEHTASVIAFIKSRGMACSVYGSQFLLEGLYRYNEGNYALDLMRSTGDRSWWNMIRSGSTITMEAWDMKYKPNSDWNHAWGAVPANMIPRGLWGIRPTSAGFKTAIIAPQMGDLAYSKIKMPTILGPVRGDFRKVGHQLKSYMLEIPEGMAAGFRISLAEGETCWVNGVKTSMESLPTRLKSGKNKIEIRNNTAR